MLFTGSSDHTIDTKLRLAIPAKHRSQVGEGTVWYCVPWPGGVLRLYPEATFRDLASRAEQSLTPSEDEASIEASVFGFAERLEQDGQGRIALPKLHLELAEMKGGEVVVLGVRNRLEVRERAAWEAQRQAQFARLPDLVARLRQGGNGSHGGN